MKPALFTKIFDGRSLDEAIETAAEIGYDGIEIMARDPHLPPDTTLERAAEIRALVDENDLQIPCLATYTGGYSRSTDEERTDELETFERYLQLSETLEVDLLRHGAGRPPLRDATDEDFEIAAEWLRRAADLAADYDRRIGLEIHAHRLTETVDSTLRLLDLVDRDNVGAIHDAGNMFIVGDDFGPESVERLGDRLFHVHVKDISRVDDSDLEDTFPLNTDHGEELFRRELLGEGDADHGPLFDALTDAGYDGYATAETNVARIDPETVAEEELARLTDLIERST